MSEAEVLARLKRNPECLKEIEAFIANPDNVVKVKLRGRSIR